MKVNEDIKLRKGMTKREWIRKKENQDRMSSNTKPKKNCKNKMGGFNSWKFSVLRQSNGLVNILDLKGIDDTESEEYIEYHIKLCLEKNNFPLRVITHSVVDKIIILNKIISKYENLKTINLDPCNPFTYCVVPK